MSEVILFTPGGALSAPENLTAFISFCRDKLTAYGENIRFDDDVWDISDHVDRRGHGDKLHRLRFSHGFVKGKPEVFLKAPFKDFAKAYLRYSQALAPVQDAARRLSAMRVLERTISEVCDNPCVTAVNQNVLNRAAAIAKKEFSQAVAYQVGQALEVAAALLPDLGIVRAPVGNWANPNPRKLDIRNRIGPEFDANREEHLPTDADLRAVAKAYLVANTPLDVAITSIAALMCCAPDRVNEIISLPYHCDVERERADGTREFGLRWPGSKGAPDHIKWILPSMESLAREALGRLKKVTEEARVIASWYQKYPTKIYLPAELEHLRGREILDADEFAAVAAVSKRHKRDWYDPRGIRPVCVHPWRISFRDVERAMLNELPRTFPKADKRTELKFADALCVFPLNFTRSEWATSRCGIQSLTINQLNQQLGSSLKHGKTSVFSRLGINLPDGSPVVLTTNDFRHFLNTIAQGSGLTQFDIAKWSGRVNEQQNAAYDHVPALVLLSECNELLDLQTRSGELTAVERRVPVSMRDFQQLGFKTAHSTDSGFCVHDFVMLPCQLQLDCDNCDEHACIKGDQIKTAHIRERLSLSRELLQKAEVGVADGRRGADRWLRHHRTTVERLEKLVAILDDPSIPVGAIIRLSRTHGASLIDSAAIGALGPLNDRSAEDLTARQVLARVDQLQLAASSQ